MFVFLGVWAWAVHARYRDHALKACGKTTYGHSGQLPHQDCMSGIYAHTLSPIYTDVSLPDSSWRA